MKDITDVAKFEKDGVVRGDLGDERGCDTDRRIRHPIGDRTMTPDEVSGIKDFVSG